MATDTQHRDTWATYQAAWGDVGAEERLELLSRSVSDDCVYSDPVGRTADRDELIAYIEQFRKTMQAPSFRNHKFLDHHDQAMAEWTLYDGEAEAQQGSSYARFAPDGRLSVIAGFFEMP